MQRIVLAYSGSLETTRAIAGLKARYGGDVIALSLDVGQGRELEAVRDRALAAGAVRAHVLDVRDEFAREFVLPSLKADALAGGRVVLARALTRPLVARKLVEIADIEQADAVAHGGAAGAGATASPLDRLIAAVNPVLPIVALPPSPDHDGGDGRAELSDPTLPGFEAAGAPAPRVEVNLWGRTIRDGAAREGIFTLTRPPAECPAEPAVVEIAFDRGAPKAINGVFMPLLELIGSLGLLAGAHGVGRVAGDGVVCEAPAALLLHAAHAELQGRLVEADLAGFADRVSRAYVDVVETGRWFTPLREALDAFVEKVQERITGTVRLKLFKGDVISEERLTTID